MFSSTPARLAASMKRADCFGEGDRVTRFAWKEIAKKAADQANFENTPYKMEGESFNDGGDVSPSVQIFFRRITNTEIAPTVFFGVYVEEFERQWRDRLLRAGLRPERENPTFALHSANIASLRLRPWVPYSPSDQDVASMREWLDRAFAYAKRLPASMDSLVTAIKRIGSPTTVSKPISGTR
jgi:hypothetical protein